MNNLIAKVVVINDAPAVARRLERLSTQNFVYVFVDTEQEADVLLESGQYDAVVSGQEFLFRSRLGSRSASRRVATAGRRFA